MNCGEIQKRLIPLPQMTETKNASYLTVDKRNLENAQDVWRSQTTNRTLYLREVIYVVSSKVNCMVQGYLPSFFMPDSWNV